MKINKLNDGNNSAMKFRVFEDESYINKPTVFLVSVGRDAVIELTLEQITAVLNAKGYGEPIWEVGSERGNI
jgi:hypothetical protein